MLQVEVEKYKIEMNVVDKKYYYRLRNIKTKSGLKIKSLEDQIINLTQFFYNQIDRIGMEIEDKISSENERFFIEEELLRKSNDFSPVRDLPSALQRIRHLLGAKKIYEKRMYQDEKIIKGLNTKLHQLIEKFTELQNMNSVILNNFSSLS